MKIPSWLKIFAILFVISVVLSALGAVSPDLIAPVLVLVPILFPGKNRERPTMIKILPWIWGLEIAGSLFYLLLAITGKSLGNEEIRQPTMPELLSSLVLIPFLIWGLVDRKSWFKPLLIVATLLSIALSGWVYATSAGDVKTKIELASDLFTQVVVTGYLLFVWGRRPREAISSA